MISNIIKFFVVFNMLAFVGCASNVNKHKTDVQDTSNITVGRVQKEIHVGMTGAEVIQILGSPNIVSTDKNRREVWIYDKISTETVYSKSYGFGNILVLGYGSDAGAVSKNQKSLTVIIKFDEKGLVDDFAYHSSKF